MATPPDFRSFYFPTLPVVYFHPPATILLRAAVLQQAFESMNDKAPSQGIGNRVQVIVVTDAPITPPGSEKPDDGKGEPGGKRPFFHFPLFGRVLNTQILALQTIMNFHPLLSMGRNPLMTLNLSSSSNPFLSLPLPPGKAPEKTAEKEAVLYQVNNQKDTPFFKPYQLSAPMAALLNPQVTKDPSTPTTPKSTENGALNPSKPQDPVPVKPPSFEQEGIKKEFTPAPFLKPIDEGAKMKTEMKGNPEIGKNPSQTPSEGIIKTPIQTAVLKDPAMPNEIIPKTAPANTDNRSAVQESNLAQSTTRAAPQAAAPLPNLTNPSTAMIVPLFMTQSSQDTSSRKKGEHSERDHEESSEDPQGEEEEYPEE